MAVTRIYTGTINGIDGELVSVEVDTAPGLPNCTIVGLPDATVNEARERVKSAIKNAGFEFPLKKVLINLAPADTKKAGSAFDLPIAIGILHSCEYFPEAKLLENACFIGELSLDGSIRSVKGVLAIALMAKAKGLSQLIVPKANMAEASLVEGLEIYGLAHLSELPLFLDKPELFRSPLDAQTLLQSAISDKPKALIDFADVKGQHQVKRALEIAAAGGHNIALFGPPGSGKSMLAKAFTGILPPMDFEEILEVSRIYSVAGLLDGEQVIMPHRPFRSPHHSASMAGITGGGSHPKPGEITLAHRGVLFLDEFPEFARQVLEVLRQPLEDGLVTVSRAQQSVTFPAQFMLVAAMNPCPCGFKGDSIKPCLCNPHAVERYLGKVSGPLMDRIDLHLEVPRLNEEELLRKNSRDGEAAESSEAILQRVITARNIQRERFAALGIRTNSEMQSAHLKDFCKLDPACETILSQAIKRFHLSGRSFDRILKLTRTIADLSGSVEIEAGHIAEALQYRGFEKLHKGQSRSLASI